MLCMQILKSEKRSAAAARGESALTTATLMSAAAVPSPLDWDPPNPRNKPHSRHSVHVRHYSSAPAPTKQLCACSHDVVVACAGVHAQVARGSSVEASAGSASPRSARQSSRRQAPGMYECVSGTQYRSDALTDALPAMQMWRPSHSLRTWRSCASSQSSMPSGEMHDCAFVNAVWGWAGACGGQHADAIYVPDASVGCPQDWHILLHGQISHSRRHPGMTRPGSLAFARCASSESDSA